MQFCMKCFMCWKYNCMCGTDLWGYALQLSGIGKLWEKIFAKWCVSSLICDVKSLLFHCFPSIVGIIFQWNSFILIMLTFEVEVTVLLQKSGDTCHIEKDLKLCLHCCENITYHSLCAQHVSNWKCQNYMEKLMCAWTCFEKGSGKYGRKAKSRYFHGILVACQCFGGTYCLKMEAGSCSKTLVTVYSIKSHTRWLQSCAVCVTHDMTWHISTDATEPLLTFFGKKSLKLF